jgi:hypothetical protein
MNYVDIEPQCNCTVEIVGLTRYYPIDYYPTDYYRIEEMRRCQVKATISMRRPCFPLYPDQLRPARAALPGIYANIPPTVNPLPPPIFTLGRDCLNDRDALQ